MATRNGNHEKIIDAIRAGRTTPEALCAAVNLDRIGLSSAIGYMRRQGVIAYDKISPTQIDWTSLRVLGEEPAPKAAPKKTKAKAAAPAPVEAAADSIELARGATIDDGTIEMFKRWAESLRAKATEIDAMVVVLEELPRLGAEGALVFRLLGKLHGQG